MIVLNCRYFDSLKGGYLEFYRGRGTCRGDETGVKWYPNSSKFYEADGGCSGATSIEGEVPGRGSGRAGHYRYLRCELLGYNEMTDIIGRVGWQW